MEKEKNKVIRWQTTDGKIIEIDIDEFEKTMPEPPKAIKAKAMFAQSNIQGKKNKITTQIIH